MISIICSGQNSTQITFEYTNPNRINSYIKINFSLVESNESVIVYCNVYKKEFYRKVLQNDYLEIIDLVKKISPTQILKQGQLYLDGSKATIKISNFETSVSYSISGLSDPNLDKQFSDFKYVALKILSVANLKLSDLR